jgi:PAS domain S-box-containing protein
MAVGNLPFDPEAFEYLIDAIIIVDNEQKITYYNGSAAKLYDLAKEKALGQKISEIFTIQWSAPQDQAAFTSSIVKKNYWSGQNCHIKSNGEKFSAASSVRVFEKAGDKFSIFTVQKLDSSPKEGPQSSNREPSSQILDSSVSKMNLDKQELTNLIDIQALQSMMDDLYAVSKIGFSLIDLRGNILAANGWQDICTKFHRVNPQSLWNCLESDLILTQGVSQGEFRAYKCKNNMWDIVTPVVIGNKHVANLFSGQFFFDDEIVDKDLFIKQAERFGIDKEAYLAALDKVPRWNRDKVTNLMQFYVKLAEMISKLSYGNLKLSKLLFHQKNIEKELRESHHDLKHAQSMARAGSWRLDVNNNQLIWSEETYRLFGIPVGKPLTYEVFLASVYPEDRERVDNSWKAALRGEKYDIEHRIVVGDNILWVHEKAELEFDKDGSLVCGFGTVQDITGRKIDEQKLEKLNRTLRAISNSNQAIARANDENAFLRQGCRIIVEDCGYALVWIGFALDDAEKSIKPMAYAGFDNGYIESLKLTWANSERGKNPTGTAIRTGKVQICADKSCDPNYAPWRKQVLERGYASSIVLPLFLGDKVLGAINIYSREANAFSQEEAALLYELTNDMSHGLTLLRVRDAHEKAQEMVKVNLRRFYDTLSSLNGSILLVSTEGLVEFTNQSFSKYFSLKESPSELIGVTFEDILEKIKDSYLNPDLEISRINEIISAGKPVIGEEIPMRDNRTCLRDFIPLQREVDGESFSYLFHYMDITSQKKAEEALYKARIEMERTFDSLPDLVAIIDHKHRVLRINKAMSDKLGIRPEQCFGLQCYESIHGTKKAHASCPLSKTLEDGKVHTAEVYEERLGGKVLVTTSPLQNEKGEIFGALHVVHPTK